MNLKKGLLVFAAVFLVACMLFFGIKLVGFALNTPSSVSIEQRITVNFSSFDGETTNFSDMSNHQLRNINEMTLERKEYGKIIFQESVDLTLDNINWNVDLDSNVNISHEYIEIDTDKLTSLEKQALIYMYNLSFINPRILRNGTVCPGSICQEIDYSSGTLIFTVTSFTNYSAEETPVEVNETPAAGEGGGGGGGTSVIKNFTVDIDLIKISLKQGESRREVLIIKNGNAASKIILRIDSKDLNRYMIINEESLSLAAGETKSVNVDFFVGENEAPETYLGRIIISSGDVSKVVSVILEVKEKQALFDVVTKVQNRFVSPGQKVNADIKLTNVGDLRAGDVTLYYAIKDFNNSVITFGEETFSINQEVNLVRGLNLPEDIPFGRYVFYSSITYGGNLAASSSDVFEVVTARELLMRNLMIAFLIILFLVTVIMLIRLYGAKRKERELKKPKTN